VSGLTHPWSDVDIALILGEALAPAKQLKVMLSLQVDLADCCDIDNADVRIIDDAPLILRGKVVTEGILLYARDEQTRVDFEVNTRLRYFDYLPVYREMQETFLATLRERGLYG
jgi:predicted nucleotidyltransferase